MTNATTKVPTQSAGSEAEKVTRTLTTDQGATTINDIVVQKIAALATRDVSGVHDLGGGAARAFGAIRERIPGASASAGQGVSVEVGRSRPPSTCRSSSSTACPSPTWPVRSAAT